MSPRPQAIIFDMDGVIADTEFVDLRIQTDFVRSARRELGEEPVEVDPAQLMGRSYEALWGRLGELVGAGWSLDETRRRFSAFDAAARRALDYGALFRPGVNDVLDLATERGLLTAVCSSSSHAHIAEVLSACGVLGRFDVISSGEDVAESKPDPEVYLRCVASLSDACGRPIDAARCIAIEDSEHGIAAARAAGVGCVIAYEEARVSVDQSAAHVIARDMADVRRIVQGLLD